MFKNQLSDDDQILQTIQLTSKLEDNLRKIMSNRKNNSLKTQYNERELDRSQYESLQSQVRKLKAQNKELAADNEQVCRDLLHLKEQNRELKREVSEHKKYITYLQSYIQDLKKQLVFWMRKPLHGQQQPQNNTFGNLMTQVLKLRRENETKQLELHDLKNTVQPVKLVYPVKQIKQTPSNRASHKKKMSILDELRTTLNPPAKTTKKNSVNPPPNECTSCNYQLYVSSKHKRVPSSASLSGKKSRAARHLCDCHRRYVQTSQFLS